MQLDLQQIRKAFDDHYVLTDCTYTFQQGKIYGLLGRNGSGKTTLFKTLYGEEEADGGQALLQDGDHSRPLQPQDVGLVYAEPFLPEFLTGYEYIKFYMDLHQREGDDSRPDAYLDRFGFSDKDRHKLIQSYSSGMKSKLGVLCIFISKPKVIFLDEPLTAIDVVASKQIKDMLLELRDDHILILSTHIIQLAKDLCDEIVLLNQGKLQHFETAIHQDDFDDSLVQALTAGESDA